MSIKPTICTQCGAAVSIGLGLKGVCEFCGTTLVVERQKQNIPPIPPPQPNFGAGSFNQMPPTANPQDLVKNGQDFLLKGDFNAATIAFLQASSISPNWAIPFIWLAKSTSKGFTDFTNSRHIDYMKKAQMFVDPNTRQSVDEAMAEYNAAKEQFVKENAPIFKQKVAEYNAHDAKYSPMFKLWLPLVKASTGFSIAGGALLGSLVLTFIFMWDLAGAILGFLGAIFLIGGLAIRVIYNAKFANTVKRVGNESEEMIHPLIRFHRAITFINPSAIAGVEVIDYGKKIDLKDKWHHVQDEPLPAFNLGGGFNSPLNNLGNDINNMVNNIMTSANVGAQSIINATINSVNDSSLGLDDIDIDFDF